MVKNVFMLAVIALMAACPVACVNDPTLDDRTSTETVTSTDVDTASNTEVVVETSTEDSTATSTEQ
jgi:hypothetical protein